jgi:hypothetical protein
MWLSFSYALPYLLHDRPVQNTFYSLLIKIAQHVGIASTTDFNVTSGIDVQAPPGSCTIEIVHTAI